MPDVDTLASGHLEEVVLNEYLDGVLDAAAGGRVAEHLAGCASCSGRLENLRALFLALDEMPEAPLGRDLVKGVLAKIAPPVEIAFSTRARLLLGLQVVFAAALAAALWPVIEAGLTAEVYWQAGEAAVFALMQIVSGWQELALALPERLGILEQWIPQGSELPFSTLQVALLLSISVLAWLAVNDRLIGVTQTDKKSNQMKRRKV